MTKTNRLSGQDFRRLISIHDELKELVSEAKQLVQQSGNNMAWERAKAYWLAQLEMSLDNEHDYLGDAGVNMQQTINELAPDAADEDEDFDEDDE